MAESRRPDRLVDTESRTAGQMIRRLMMHPVQGPYVAVTFPVAVEEEYVVVEA